MRIFNMEESTIIENDWEWLHELPLNNTVLEELNFYMTNLTRVNSKDIKRIATRCPNLTSIKVSDCDISGLIDFFKVASLLEEFGIGSSNEPQPQPQPQIGELLVHAISKALPPRLCRLGLTHLRIAEMPIFYHVRTVIGDHGLIVLAQCCTRIKRLRILLGTDEQVMEDEGGVSNTGLVALALGCCELEQLNVFVWDITNESLECIGKCLKELRDFRLCLIKEARIISDLPLDFGVKSVLRGCEKLTRLGWIDGFGFGKGFEMNEFQTPWIRNPHH
ncbi:hypothetical protein BUALT_Bualt01G0051600 [Buddleja alternifolia]|uniref:Uncharacterized protein n=1 Tax=Buddleja alternifolia TaxID=168488 RepID=A0AAV6Y4P0_9LAMI|nr:hypothetical protein BUALT_Bualt01G0051600 [Buddleja alternifolia]